VIVLSGRFAGRKAVVIRTFDDGAKDRKFGHALVAGIDRAPRKVTKKMDAKKKVRCLRTRFTSGGRGAAPPLLFSLLTRRTAARVAAHGSDVDHGGPVVVDDPAHPHSGAAASRLPAIGAPGPGDATRRALSDSWAWATDAAWWRVCRLACLASSARRR
jgi:hypothetical protein